MANPEHVALVRKGKDAIAEWREAHPEQQLDLSGADLENVNLSGADLSRAIMTGANLTACDLSASNLSGASLWDCDLKAANLSHANLSEASLLLANLAGANLYRANLTNAELVLVNVYDANLAEADLSEVLFGLASLGKVDLSKTRGLEFVHHVRPSTIGIDTVIDSSRGAGGKLPPELLRFFRGAGVPDELLKEVPRIVADVEYYTCFISYGQHDLDFAKKLTEDLRAKGVSCWLWETDKTVGQRTQHEIEEKLEEYNRMVVLCSIYSLLAHGIRSEVYRQWAKDPDKLVPVSLEDGWKHDNYRVDCLGKDLKPFLVDRNYADFANKPYDDALTELLKGLRRP